MMTVEEFRALPEIQDKLFELHDGRVVEFPRPNFGYWSIQTRLVDLLGPLTRLGALGIEFVFRPTEEHNLWAADVGFVPTERERNIDPDDNLHGAPDLMIEIVSPGSVAAELEEREVRCIGNGCQEFWVVFPGFQRVKVMSNDGRFQRYRAGDVIELSIAPGVKVAVDDIFRSDQ